LTKNKKNDTQIDPKELAIKIAQIARDLKGKDVVLLDLKGKSPATNYYLIATGTSDRQIRTMADDISKFAKNAKWQLFGRAGYDQAKWVLLDFVDVVVHLFDAEYREFYDLEMLWGDAKRIEI